MKKTTNAPLGIGWLECKGPVFFGNEAQKVRVILRQIQSSLFFLESLEQRIES